jgi:hypothetical protein
MRFFKHFLLGAIMLMGMQAFGQMARLQVIHNAADPAADSVDVYVNGARLLKSFHFRTATPFIDVPAGVLLNIGVAPANSSSVNDTLKNFQVTLAANKKYVAIANGVLSTTGFLPNPDSRSIKFSLFASDNMRESGMSSTMVDINAFHGATDAPTVDVVVRGQSMPLIDNITYGNFSGYKSVPPKSYVLDVTPGSNNGVIVASFKADLSGLGGGAAVVFASGFLDPKANHNGKPFGLFAALPNGTVVELPQITTARLQVIHNAADPAADLVDVYVNGALLLDNFKFRTATPFIDVPAGVSLNIGIAPGNSKGVMDTLKNFLVSFIPAKTYVAIANGILDPTKFSPNPDGRSIAFTLFAKDDIREKGTQKFLTDLIVFHGSTDAPSVKVAVKGLGFLPLVNNLAYGSFSKYLRVLPLRYTLEIIAGKNHNHNNKEDDFESDDHDNHNNGKKVLASFVADLRGLGGASAIVIASGFLDPSRNQKGASFGLFAVLPDGKIVELPPVKKHKGGNDAALQDPVALADNNVADANVSKQPSLMQNYPNPFNPATSISFSLSAPEYVSLKVFNMLGQEVASLVDSQKEVGMHSVTFNASDLASGTYIYRLKAGNYVETKKLILMK